MDGIFWERHPLVADVPSAKAWLAIQANLGLAPRTIDAYSRALNDYLAFCVAQRVAPVLATRAHIAGYIRDLSTRPSRSKPASFQPQGGDGLANATIQQRVTVVRLYYDYLVEERLRSDSPVARGRWTPGTGFGGTRARGLVPRYRTLPWIPTEAQWIDIVAAARQEGVRNRLMFALSYDAALRREELCSLSTSDIDPAHRLIRVRAETTKNRQERVVPYSAATTALYGEYLRHRRTLSRSRGPLFLSESRRNRADAMSIWAWSKIVQTIALRANIPGFSPHTLRHLCLTDLARAGWDIHEIATFAGHRSIQSTLLYIHLSGRDLGDRLAQTIASLHTQRVESLLEVPE